MSERAGIFCTILSGMLYGLLGYFGMSLVNVGFSVNNMIFWRFFFSSLSVMPFLFFIDNSSLSLLNRKDMSHLFIAVFSYAGCSAFFFMASIYIGTGLAMVLFFTYPVFIFFFDLFVRSKVPSSRELLAFSIIFIGIIFLVDLKSLKLDVLGIVLAMMAGLSYASYLIFGKKQLTKLSPVLGTFLASFGNMLLFFMLTCFEGTFLLLSEPSEWVSALGVGIIATSLPIYLLLIGLKSLEPIKAAILSVTEPLFSVIFGALLLGETFHSIQGIGITCVLLGSLLVQQKQSVTIKVTS